MSQRATKQETELRIAHAAELVAEGQAYSSITSLVAAKYGISRRRARQITSNAYLLLKNDIEEGDLNCPEMTAKISGAKRTRTADPLHAMQVLYQLSYGPKFLKNSYLINLKIAFVTALISILLYRS